MTTVEQWANRLDAVRPGWHQKVNPETLNIFNSYNCILGQVFAEESALNYVGTPWGFGLQVLGVSYGDDVDIFACDEYLEDWLTAIKIRTYADSRV